MNVRDLLHDAARGVRLHRVRSLLTAASFAAGTAAALSLFAMTDGARAELLRRIQALGTDVVAIRPVGEPAAGEPPFLTAGDSEALARGLPFVRAAAPVRFVESSVLLPDERVTVRVVGTTPEYFELLRLPFRRGRPFSGEERAGGVCILGAGAARVLFPGGGGYGSLVNVGGNWYRVMGILSADASIGGIAGGGVEGTGREIYLPIVETLRGSRSRHQSLREIWMRIDSGLPPEAVAPVIHRALLRRHDGRERFEVATPERLLRQQRAARGLLDLLLAAVAAGAFGLGAVGMMSVSWQSVAARTREIAIRRAVGARRDEILAQFVLEGIGIAAAGAVAGLVAGTVLSGGAAWAGGWPWMLSPARLMLAAGIALAIGFASTLLPAYRAATLDPVAALRFSET